MRDKARSIGTIKDRQGALTKKNAAAVALPAGGEAWRRLAETAQVPAGGWTPPTVEQFAAAVRGVHARRGGLRRVDKGRAPRPCGAHNMAPAAHAGMQAAGGVPDDARDALYTWCVAGIPKGKPEESRPVAVASCIARTWHRNLLEDLPAGRAAGQAPTFSKTRWIGSRADLDLAKASNRVDLAAAPSLEYLVLQGRRRRGPVDSVQSLGQIQLAPRANPPRLRARWRLAA